MTVAAVIVQLYFLPGSALLCCTGPVYVAASHSRSHHTSFTCFSLQIEMERSEGLVQRRRQPKVEENTEPGVEEREEEEDRVSSESRTETMTMT